MDSLLHYTFIKDGSKQPRVKSRFPKTFSTQKARGLPRDLARGQGFAAPRTTGRHCPLDLAPATGTNEATIERLQRFFAYSTLSREKKAYYTLHYLLHHHSFLKIFKRNKGITRFPLKSQRLGTTILRALSIVNFHVTPS
jgi:hypothetical protein